MTSYNDFMLKQSNEFQNDTLGEDKASKLRDGTLQLDKFQVEKGLTLEQLKSKRSIICGKAQPVADKE